VATTSQHHLLHRAEKVGLLMRHTANVFIATAALADPASGAGAPGRWLLVALLVWSLCRLVRRSLRPRWSAADFALTLAVCLAIGWLTTDPGFYLTNSAPQAIAGTAVVSFSVCLPARFTLPMTLMIAGAYAVGVAEVAGWDQVGSVPAVYYFALQWVTASMIRLMVLRVAAVADRARDARDVVELGRQVQRAVHGFEREQLSLLHDTAASTLLMVGQGVALPRDRLAAQARRDLALLQDNSWQSAPAHLDIVTALQIEVGYARTAIKLDGPDSLWVDGVIGRAVIAATREAMNNIDRHASATTATISVAPHRIVITDDGAGFDLATARAGRGIAESMTGRMRNIGGDAALHSAPGRGTSVELTWPATVPEQAHADLSESEGLINRVRHFYGIALVAYAVVNLAMTVPRSVGGSGAPAVQWTLAGVAALCALAALPVLAGWSRKPIVVGIVAAAVVVVLHSLVLSPEELGSQVDWVQAGIGWCVLPLVLTIPFRCGGSVLAGLWALGAVVELVRHPVPSAWINIGLGTGSILIVELFALAFGALLSDTAAAVHSDVVAHHSLVVGERIAVAVAEDYRRRYATLVDGVIPLLELLSATGVADAAVQRQARAESRRLRVLFDQSKTFDHPLMRQLRPVMDAAEARNVDVSVDVSGVLPDADDVTAAHLVAVAECALDTGPASVHLVVNGGLHGLSMSVLCRQVTDAPAAAAELRGMGVEVITDADTVWVIVERPHSMTR